LVSLVSLVSFDFILAKSHFEQPLHCF
jgi:hypothetical protein